MTPAPPDAPPTGAVCGDGVAAVDVRYACAAGGRLSGASLGGDSEEADRSVRGGRRAPGSPCGARGRNVWRRHAAPRSPAGRGTGRAGVRGAGVARVVVVARPVVRHTRPTADCRPAASGPFVSRSSSCACSPCGDPQTSGWLLPLRWLLTLGWLQTLRWSLALRWFLTLRWFLALRWSLPSGWWPRSGEWRLVRASPSRRSRRGPAPRRPVGARARRRVLTGPARRASGRRTVAARVSLGGEWSSAPQRRRGWRRAPAPP